MASRVSEMADKETIRDIKDKTEELIRALRDLECEEPARLLERHAREFTSHLEVRRAVSAIQQQLELWRDKPGELPESVRVQVAARQLEDACRGALSIGAHAAAVIPLASLPPSLGERSWRYLKITVFTLLAGAAVFGLPVALAEAGIDWINFQFRYETEAKEMAQGEEGEVRVSVLAEAELPEHTHGLELHPAEPCNAESWTDWMSLTRWSCQTSSRRLSLGQEPTYEINRHGDYRGLLFAVTDTGLIGAVGSATVRLFATEKTPPGTYRIPLAASYFGYRPADCWGVGRFQKCVAAVAQQDAKHTGLKVPVVVVRVTPGESLGEGQRIETRAEKAAAETGQKREEHRGEEAGQSAEELAAKMQSAGRELDAIARLLRRRRWQQAHRRLNDFEAVHTDLNAAVIGLQDSGELQVQLAGVRDRFEKQREVLDGFENRVFDALFEVLQEQTGVMQGASAARTGAETGIGAEKGTDVGPEGERIRKKVARRFDIAVSYLHEIYDGRAGEARVRREHAAREQLAKEHAEWASVDHRCGAVPEDLAAVVAAYLRDLSNDAEVTVHECLPAKLTQRDCWVSTCTFSTRDASGAFRRRTSTFHVQDGQVARHLGR